MARSCPPVESGMLYSMGFVVATGCLHGIGISIGLIHRWASGRVIAPCGGRHGGGRGRLFSLFRAHMTLTKHQPTRIRSGKIAAGAVLLCLGCPRAEAHLVTTGLGPLYDGMAHLALSPADLATVVVLTLLAAMRGPSQGRWLLLLLPAAWLVGGLTGLMLPINANPSWATGVSLLLAGALVAADRNLPLPVVATLATLIGAFHGFLTGAAFAGTPSAAARIVRDTSGFGHRGHAPRRAGGVDQGILGTDRRAGAGKLDRGHGSLDDRLESARGKLKDQTASTARRIRCGIVMLTRAALSPSSLMSTSTMAQVQPR